VGSISVGAFNTKVIIFVCIHDAPGGFTVSGQTKEKSGCPICVDGTASVYLPSSRKLVSMRHRWFLERKHKYCKMKRYFDNTVEKDSAPKWYTGNLLFEMVKNIQGVFGKGTVRGQKRKKTPTSTDILSRSNQFFSSTFHTGRILKLATSLI
jgi:hypothetical protein